MDKIKTTQEILHLASGELTAIAANYGINWQSLYQQITPNQTVYKRGIELDKGYRGRVAAFVNFRTSKSGFEHLSITFNTFRHYLQPITWDSFKWLEDNGYIAKQSASTSTSISAVNKYAAKVKTERDYQYKLKVFNETAKLYDDAEILTSVAGTYLAKKGFADGDLFNTELRHGSDERGQFIVFAVGNDHHAVTGFQKIYSKDFVDNNGDERHKDFCFKPLLNENGEVATYKNGSYAVIGELGGKDDLVYVAEGYATGLSVHIATGNPVVVALDAPNLPHVIKALSEKGYENIVVAADNDFKADNGGNVGIFAAIQAVRYTKFKIAIPFLDGQKADFNDVMLTSGIGEVKRQLIDSIISAHTDQLNYHLDLIKYAPKARLKGVIATACGYAGAYRIATIQDFKDVFRCIRKAVAARGFTDTSVRYCLKKYFKKNKLSLIQSGNCITNFDGIVRHDCTGMDNRQIFKKIRSVGSGIFIDSRQVGVGKTELMEMVANYALNRESGNISNTDVKEFHLCNGGNSESWAKINFNPKAFNEIFNELKKQQLPPRRKKTVVAVAPRTALVSSLSNRLDVENYENASPAHYKDLAICVNSMPKFSVSEHVEVLFIDEIRQTLEHVLNGPVDNRTAVYNELIAAINKASLVICADADMNDSTVNWLKSIANKPLHAITQKPAKTGKSIIELGNAGTVLHYAAAALGNGKNVLISTDSKTQVRKSGIHLSNKELSSDVESVNEIAAEFGMINPKDMLLIHSENKADHAQAAFLANPNKESKKYRLVIHSPVISSGVSIENSHFDSVFAIFCNVIAPNEMLQTIGRVRKAKEIFVCFKANHAKDRPTNLTDLIDGQAIKVGRFNSDKFVTEYDDFDRLRLGNIAARNASLNDYRRYFLILAQLKGYSFRQFDMRGIEIKGLGAAAKQIKIDEVYLAPEISIKHAKTLSLRTALTQEESDSLHRHNVTVMTGKHHRMIDDADIKFYLDNGLSRVANYELLNSDNADLMESDNNNHATRDKLSSKLSKKIIIEKVIKAIDDRSISTDVAINVCKILKENHKEIAANGLGNFKKISKYPIRQLNDFLKRFGFELVEDEKPKGSERTYKLEVNSLVLEYSKTRAEIRQIKSYSPSVALDTAA